MTLKERLYEEFDKEELSALLSVTSRILAIFCAELESTKNKQAIAQANNIIASEFGKNNVDYDLIEDFYSILREKETPDA